MTFVIRRISTSAAGREIIERATQDELLQIRNDLMTLYRPVDGTDGPLFLGRDTHGLSEPAWVSALEVLAVIAYRQPVTRAEIEAMRGASASTVLTLQERELVKVVGRSDAVGHPLLYGTTDKFLLEFGLKTLDDLPLLQNEDFSHLLRS